MRLSIMPLTLRAANQYVREYHRHHPPAVGAKFAVGLVDKAGRQAGAGIAGRPAARMLDDGLTLEVTRLCTDGTKNACSMLYGAIRRVAAAMGYRRLATYTLPEEGGASLRASGWTLAGEAGGGSWCRPSRFRQDKHPTVRKLRWEIRLRMEENVQ